MYLKPQSEHMFIHIATVLKGFEKCIVPFTSCTTKRDLDLSEWWIQIYEEELHLGLSFASAPQRFPNSVWHVYTRFTLRLEHETDDQAFIWPALNGYSELRRMRNKTSQDLHLREETRWLKPTRAKKFAKYWIITWMMKVPMDKIPFQVSIPVIKPHMQINLFKVEELQTLKSTSHD